MNLPPHPEKYSAEIVRSDGLIKRVFVNEWMRRIESGGTITIFRPDKEVIWFLKPTEKLYNERKMRVKTVERVLNPESLCDWTNAGTEAINGRECHKFVGKYKFSADKQEAYEICYVEVDSGIRRREVTFNKNGKQVLVVDSLNVQIGPPDSKVFEVPKDYKKTRKILF